MLQALLLYCVVSRLSRASDGDVPARQVPADSARQISAVRRYLHLLNAVHVMGGVGDQGKRCQGTCCISVMPVTNSLCGE